MGLSRQIVTFYGVPIPESHLLRLLANVYQDEIIEEGYAENPHEWLTQVSDISELTDTILDFTIYISSDNQEKQLYYLVCSPITTILDWGYGRDEFENQPLTDNVELCRPLEEINGVLTELGLPPIETLKLWIVQNIS